jgi:hypothetical protein
MSGPQKSRDSGDDKSIEPILREIDALVQRIRAADVPSDQEYRRIKALVLLEGVGRVLKEFCAAEDPPEGFAQFNFARKGKPRGG